MSGNSTAVQPRVFLNDSFVPAAEAQVSAFDAGFIFGAGVFETIRGKNGEPAYFDRHYARLQHSCAQLGIVLKPTEAELFDTICELLAINDLGGMEARIKLVATPGDTNMHRSHRAGTLLISAIPYIRPSPRIPWKLLLRDDVFATPISGHKSTSYLGYRMALREAHDSGYDDVILLDRHGNIAETAVASLFLFREGRMILPVSDDALPGTARSVIADIARARGIDVREMTVSKHDVLNRTSVCICNALIGPFPIGRINEQELPPFDGAMLRALRDAWM